MKKVGQTYKANNYLSCKDCHKKTLFRMYVNGYKWTSLDRKEPTIMPIPLCQKCSAKERLKQVDGLYDKNKYDYLKDEK